MKKLGKLSINPERVMKSEELVNLRGGDYGYGAPCTCSCFKTDMTCGYGYVLSEFGDCSECDEVWSGSIGTCGNAYPMPACC